jgi:DNA-directed RNA polymerase specialized sigma24 family protein
MSNIVKTMLNIGLKNELEQPQMLYEALQRQSDKAILFVQRKTLKTVASMTRFAGLSAMDSEEILNDSVIILLQKIENGAYQFQGYDPCTYMVEIAKGLIANAKRKNKRSFEDIETQYDLADNDTEHYLEIKANETVLRNLMSQIGENCQKLISLKYLEEFKDEEILAQKMTQYSSINTLKVKRSECMKKLSELAIKFKNNNE